MTLPPKLIRRKQVVRDIYARIKQLDEELGLDKDGWGDVQDELGSAMSHLEIADRLLSAPDPDELVKS